MGRQAASRKARRQASKEHRRVAAAARARVRRRNQFMLAALAALAVVGIVVGITLLAGSGSSSDTDALGSGASPTPTATAAGFPSLPAGADPALATRPVVEAGTGDVIELKVTTLIEGTGPAAQNGKTVEVNYVGVTYKDGEEFDASWNGQQTFPVTLGAGGVIKGWDQGLVGVKEGSRVQLDIPANLAYGDPAPEGYPSGALRFVVDVLSVS